MRAIQRGGRFYLELTAAELDVLIAALRYYLSRKGPRPAEDAAFVARMLARVGKGAQ
jgi:hypothetical protein